MTITTFRKKFKLEIRNEILRHARNEFVHEGYGGFSMRRLAELVGCVPSAIYKHFASKAEVFDCLVQESLAALMQASSSVPDLLGEDPIDRLKRGLWAYVTFGLENPDHYQFAFVLQSPDSKRLRVPSVTYEALKGRIRKCIDAGHFPKGDLDLMAQSLWASAHGITSLLIQKPLFPWVPRQRLISQIIDASVSGLMHPQRKERKTNGVG
jgi:AcrR family transcriptional regulator